MKRYDPFASKLLIIEPGQSMHRITDRLLASGIAEASNHHFLAGNEVAAILSVCEDRPDDNGVPIFHSPFEDAQHATDDQIFTAVLMLRRVIEIHDGRVLLHCHAGISRAPLVAALYLGMKHTKWSFKRCLEYVERGRPVAWPNPSFKRRGPRILKRLREYGFNRPKEL